MTHVENTQVEQLLQALHKAENYTMFSADLYGDLPDMDSAARRKDDLLLELGLITEYKAMRSLSGFGLEVCQNGGWLEYVKQEEQHQAIEEERQRKQDEKLKYEVGISKYLYKTRWWPLIISIISLIAAILALLKDKL